MYYSTFRQSFSWFVQENLLDFTWCVVHKILCLKSVLPEWETATMWNFGEFRESVSSSTFHCDFLHHHLWFLLIFGVLACVHELMYVACINILCVYVCVFVHTCTVLKNADYSGSDSNSSSILMVATVREMVIFISLNFPTVFTRNKYCHFHTHKFTITRRNTLSYNMNMRRCQWGSETCIRQRLNVFRSKI